MSGYDFGLTVEVMQIALAPEIDQAARKLPEGSTDDDHDCVWLSVALWPIMAQVMADHGVSDEVRDDLRLMLHDLVMFSRSQGWDAGARAVAETYERGMPS